ncbi:MAG: sulfatase-like hydrolase/transferase [Planctomycetota bacterium]
MVLVRHLALIGCLASSFACAGPPNVVLIVADDLGYGDVGFNGCQDIPTPHLDQLAQRGVVFTAGYASHPYCSPSRAGLLTGRYQQRFGHECNPSPDLHTSDSAVKGLPLTEVTLADTLQVAGYVTGAIGKWHLGDHQVYWPTRRGFKDWFGFSGGGLSYWGDLGQRDPALGLHRGTIPVAGDSVRYLTETFSTEAVKFIQRYEHEQFFLYLAYNAPHAPDQVTDDYLQQVNHIQEGGRAVYGAMVAAMDQGIGRVVDQLRESEILDNTLVIFLSDNGGRREHASNVPLRGHKGMLFEGGIRVPFLMTWPDQIAAGQDTDAPISALDIFPTVMAAVGMDPASRDDLNGINLLPGLNRAEEFGQERTLFWRYAVGQSDFGYAVRNGDWKLIDSQYKSRQLLFNLKTDPGEKRDLSMESQDTVRRLADLLEEWNATNLEPHFRDNHGENVRKEEKTRTEALARASRGDRSRPKLDLEAMIQPVPRQSQLIDDEWYIWGASMARDAGGQCHLFYSRWPRELGHMAWVTHSEIAHAVSDDPLGPYEFVDVVLPPRGAAYWDGLCTHNPTVHKFEDKYYLYYMGNTGNGEANVKLNSIHRNNQRIGVAVAEHPDGPWQRRDTPLIDVSPDGDAPDALMVSNPSILRRDDGLYVLIYKAVGKKGRLPFGGPVVHLAATSASPTGPFRKKLQPLFTAPGVPFPAEDPFIWAQGNRCWAIVNDHRGHFNNTGTDSLALFHSMDALHWEPADSPLVSRRQVRWDDGSVESFHRFERPQLFVEDGVPKVLFCAAEPSEQKLHSSNIHVPLAPIHSD